MNYTVYLSDEAIEDYDLAVAWYEQQKQGLGFDFAYRLSEAIEKIEKFPTAHQVLFEDRRCAVVERFPYKVYFIFDENNPKVLVFAILHDKRHPGLWQKRDKK